MKKTYEIYDIKSKVYAISSYYKNGKKTNYVAIYDAIVLDACIRYDEKTNNTVIDYYLSTPDGQEWGDSINEDLVNDNIDILIDKMKKIWKRESNKME